MQVLKHMQTFNGKNILKNQRQSNHNSFLTGWNVKKCMCTYCSYDVGHQ